MFLEMPGASRIRRCEEANAVWTTQNAARAHLSGKIALALSFSLVEERAITTPRHVFAAFGA
jgi:hypothetical protein